MESGSGLESDKSGGLSKAETERSKPEIGDGPESAPSAATESSKRESVAISTKTQRKCKHKEKMKSFYLFVCFFCC